MDFKHTGTMDFLSELRCIARGEMEITHTSAVRIINDESIPLDMLVEIAEIPRRRHFQKGVRIHVLNNIKNGRCSENCSYCSQRKSNSAPEIPEYEMKTDKEILEEARIAAESGAYRYCMAMSGRGPSHKIIERISEIIKVIKEKYSIEVCISAGILNYPNGAKILADSGLDRYNHNLNTSKENYDKICTSHNFDERRETIKNLFDNGVKICSGVIVGMGEKAQDLVDAAFELHDSGVDSIPVNFFIPVPGHEVKIIGNLTPEYCLKVLSMFRLVNPGAEIRLAAGRELYLSDVQPTALRIANSLFASGYLNVKGSDIRSTIEMILESGFKIDTGRSNYSFNSRNLWNNKEKSQPELSKDDTDNIGMKSMSDMRPYFSRE